MNTRRNETRYPAKTLIAAAVSLVLAACAAAPLKSTGAADARAKLTVLQSDANLATRAPVAIKDAEAAVVAAEVPQTDAAQAEHLVYLADRKVDTARAQAEARFSEDQRAKLAEQREGARLDARTREADFAKHDADVAKGQADLAKGQADLAKDQADAAKSVAILATAQAETARAEVIEQKQAADVARTDADAARVLALAQADAARSSAAQQADELQRQIADLQARPTDRGLVLTLGDVLFTTGKSELNGGATSSLDKLTSFLNHYPNRNAVIEGHTDSMGSDEYNQGLSQRRADSVKSYLMGHGIASTRLAAAGMGEGRPLAGNDSANGRQQNRRVEVIIDNPQL